jgi:hypothetical protein
MKLRYALTLVAATAIVPGTALAQNNTGGAVGGAIGGAAVGGVVGGPVGAAVGAAVGGTVGAAAPPAPVVTYVEKHPVPTVAVEEEIVVGKPLPKTVKLYSIPEHKTYRYAVVNNQRVIVDPKTRTVVKIVQ